ncbi:MAG: hypothetical protein MRY83_07885, partial [Flavobacteriales bacterium]|nr:hypothetical protein [Flavobacteriales bacterium]
HFSGIGYRSQFTEAMALEFSLGYKHQQAKMKEDYYDWWGPSSGTNTYNMQYNRVEMRIGLFIR